MTGPRRLGHARTIGDRKKRTRAGNWGRASSVGIEFSIAVVCFLLGGWWLDGKLGTDPWLTLVGLGLGSLVGFRALWRVAQDLEQDSE